MAWGTEWLDLRRERDRGGGQLHKTSKYYRGQSEEEERYQEEDALPREVEQAAVKETLPAQVLSEADESTKAEMKLRRMRRFRRFRRLLEEYGLGIQRLCSS